MYVTMIAPVLAVLLAMASAGMVGGPLEVDMSDEGAQDALRFAVAQYNRQSNDAYVSQVSQVVKVQKQLVSGLKYIFTVKMGRTSCRKGGVDTLCNLPENHDNAQLQECNIEVWSQPWLKKIQVLKNNCA